ncbi:MAG: DUF1178 family protein [Deltaproteobacteria bacterium]|jgi:hypothetical protein|nr:DUF1178 family protein [Deltaproteobacteria bacterium]
MIVYDLKCNCGCTFEGWFRDRNDFEKQKAASFLTCPRCGSSSILKLLSPVPFCSSGSKADLPAPDRLPETVSADEAEKALATLQKFVLDNFEDVGADLAKESLKIHFGAAEPRNIRGVTTDSEEKELRKEGINLLKIPLVPKKEKAN